MNKKIETAKELAEVMKSKLPSGKTNEDVFFVCIGTDRSTGDSLGPMIGTYLKQAGYDNCVGTLHNPVHATNLEETIAALPKNKIIIAIDACLGRVSSIGNLTFENSPIKPGAGVNKVLPAVGDYSITGIVNVGGFMEYFVLQNTRLSLIMDLAEKVSQAIFEVFPSNFIIEQEIKTEIAAGKQ
jgi:putative sporulation protein YyaC